MPDHRYADAAQGTSWALKWWAEHLVGLSGSGWAHPGTVPARWTAWLLMEKGGVPLKRIAYCADVEVAYLRRRLRIAKAMQFWAPYAAAVEARIPHMPRYGVTPAAKESACAAQPS